MAPKRPVTHPPSRCSGAKMSDVMDVCDLSSRQHAALRTVIKVTSGGGGAGGDDKVRWWQWAGRQADTLHRPTVAYQIWVD